jgi:hypothetical protein
MSGVSMPPLAPSGQPRLDVAHGVVAEVAGQSAAEARQPRPQRHLEALLVGVDEVQRVAFVRFDHLFVGDDFGAPPLARSSVRAGRPMKE